MAEPQYAHFTKVFIPKFVYVPKTEVEGYDFVTTLEAGQHKAHVLKGYGHYLYCLRSDDTVSTNVEWGGPLGFIKQSLTECQQEASASCVRWNVESDYRFGEKQKRYTTKKTPQLPWLLFVHKETGHNVQFQGIKDTAAALGCSYQQLRRAIVKNYPEVAGYTIVRK